MKTWWLFGLAMWMLAGCSLVEDDDDPSRQELRSQRERWEAQGFSDYLYDLRIGCFCHSVGTVRIHVRADTVFGLALVDTTKTPVDPQDFLLDYALTVDDLFDIIDDALTRADEMEVEYHAQLNYPTLISIDYNKRLADDEIAYTATALSPLR